MQVDAKHKSIINKLNPFTRRHIFLKNAGQTDDKKILRTAEKASLSLRVKKKLTIQFLSSPQKEFRERAHKLRVLAALPENWSLGLRKPLGLFPSLGME